MIKKYPFVAIILLIGVVGLAGLVGLILLSLWRPDDGVLTFSSAPVAIVKIEGPIFDSEDTLKILKEDEEDDGIRVIVLRIDSPGGAVAPSQEIYSQLLKFKKSGKKVIVSMGTIAASGGYYIAAAADKIVASPGTITGSIGVIMESFGVEDLAQTLKVEPRVIKSGKLKDTGSPFRPMTEEEKQYLQKLMDGMYGQFIADVAAERGLPVDKVKELAEGKIYSGKEAKDLGLVDELGNFYDAIDLAKKMADLPEDAKVKWPHKPSSFEKFFSSGSADESLQNFILKLGAKFMPMWILKSANTIQY